MRARILGKWMGIPVIYALLSGAMGSALAPGVAYAQGPGAWHEMTSGTHSNLHGVWGSGPNDVYAVGTDSSWLDGTSNIYHFNGTCWSEMTSGTTSTLYDVWGSSPTNIYAVGAFTILHYNGIVWDEWGENLLPVIGDPTSSYPLLLSVWGSGPYDVFFVGAGGVVLHYSPWFGDVVMLHQVESGTEYDLNDVWGSGPGDVFAVGSAGTILHYYRSIISVIDGTPVYGYWFHAMDSGTTENLYGVWGSGPNDVFAVGAHATILHYDGNSWSRMQSANIYGDTINAIRGSGPYHVFAVSDEGFIQHYDGYSWSLMDTNGFASDLYDVWGTGPRNVFAVGSGGTILHYPDTLEIKSGKSAYGGSIDPWGTIPVSYGDDQMFEFTPDPGYHIADVLVDEVSQGPLTSYTFTYVTLDHTILVVFVSTYDLHEDGDVDGQDLAEFAQGLGTEFATNDLVFFAEAFGQADSGHALP